MKAELAESGVLTACDDVVCGSRCVDSNLERVRPRVLKRGIDILLSLIALGVLSPLFVTTCFLIWRHDGQAPFFGHARIGRDGKTFRCWKFRSMHADAAKMLENYLAINADAAAEWAASQKLRDDPRVTRIGHFLRATSIDEIPQFWNVLMGHMSIVGPRPIVLDEIDRYGAHIHDYLTCRPGLTGLWQISGRSDTTYAERVRLDSEYARRCSIWQDAVIMVRTVPVLLSRRGSY